MSRPGQIFLHSFATSASFSILTFSYVFIIFISYVFIRRLNAFKRPLELISLRFLRTCLVMLRATRGSSSGSSRICVIHHKKGTNNGQQSKENSQGKQENRKTECKSQRMPWLTTLLERTDALPLSCYQSLLICLILYFLLCNLQAGTLKDFCIHGRIPSLCY